MKKLISSILCLAMLFSMSTVAFADNITTDGGSNETVVTYGMDESFLVIIPGDFTIDSSAKATADIKASNVMIGTGKSLEVTISGDDYIDSWELIDNMAADNTLTYTIGTTDGNDDIINNSVVLNVTSGVAYDSTVTETLYFTVVDELSKAGEYTDTLTFTVGLNGGISIPVKKPVFTMVHKPTNTTTTVTNGFYVSGRDVLFNEGDLPSNGTVTVEGNTVYLYDGNEYSVKIDETNLIGQNVACIDYGELGLVSLSKEFLGKTANDLAEFSVDVIWPEESIANNNGFSKTRTDFSMQVYIINGENINVPTISYTYYDSNENIISTSSPGTLWILDENAKTFILGTADTILTENMIFYVDSASILWDAATNSLS